MFAVIIEGVGDRVRARRGVVLVVKPVEMVTKEVGEEVTASIVLSDTR